MAQPTLEIAQIITVGVFICALLLLRTLLMKRAPEIRSKLVKGSRVVHVETYPLRHQAMVSLMEIDHEKVVDIFIYWMLVDVLYPCSRLSHKKG